MAQWKGCVFKEESGCRNKRKEEGWGHNTTDPTFPPNNG